MKSKSKFFLFLTLLYCIFSLIIWSYSSMLNEKINENWSQKFVSNQVEFDKSRTLLPILREISIAKEMANDDAIIQMALHEENTSIRNTGIKALEKYRSRFQDKSYFAAFKQSQHYYFNDHSNSSEPYRYKLSAIDQKDRWFYDAMTLKEAYQINVNKDNILGVTKVWINFQLRYNGKIIGIIGTGIDLSQFLDETVNITPKGVRNILINKDMAIQLDHSQELIDYSSSSKKSNELKTLNLVINDKEYIHKLKEKMDLLQNQKYDSVESLWIEIDGKKALIGIASLKEIGWFNITIIDANELELINNNEIFLTLSILFILIVIATNYLYNILFTAPLEESRKQLKTILENIDGYVYVKDTNYKYLYANKQVCDMFNTSLEKIIGKDDSDFFDSETFQEIRQNDIPVIEHGQKVVCEEINSPLEGTLIKTFLSSKIPLFQSDGSVYALCGISTDITARKAAEIKLNAFNENLQKQVDIEVQNRIKIEHEKQEKDKIIALQLRFAFIGRVIENISHQWKIPLMRFGTLITEIESLIFFKNSPQSLEAVKDILPQLRNNTALMESSIEEFHKMYTQEEAIEVFNVQESILYVWNMLAANAIATNTSLHLEIKSDISCKTFACSFSHIMMILIDNSINTAKYRKIKAPQININVEKNTHSLKIIFEDNCGGSNQTPIESIFDTSNVQQIQNNSIGLGLNIVKILIHDRLHGNIVANNLSDGIQFILTIPDNESATVIVP